jgi:2'-5' RNA ligase
VGQVAETAEALEAEAAEVVEEEPTRVVEPEPTTEEAPTAEKPAAEVGETPTREFASTQVNLSAGAAAVVQDLAKTIPDSVLGEEGRETQPHITVKYGLESDEAIEQVRELLADEPPIRATLGETSIFPSSETGSGQDVVKVDVDSPDLARINAKIAAAVPVTDTHPTYKPHVTLAYVQAGQGQQFAGNAKVAGRKLKFNQLVFSTKSGEHIAIPLKGKAVAQPAAKIPARKAAIAPKRAGKPVAEKAKPSRKKQRKGPPTVQLQAVTEGEKQQLRELLERDEKPPKTYGQTRKQFRSAIAKFLETGKPTLGSNAAMEIVRAQAAEPQDFDSDLEAVKGLPELAPATAEREAYTAETSPWRRSKALREWFGKSKVDDPTGLPRVMYHSGTFDATVDDVFDTSGIGAHFGTKGAAQDRVGGRVVDELIKSVAVAEEHVGPTDDDFKFWFTMEGYEDETLYDTEKEAQEAGEQFAMTQAEHAEAFDEEAVMTPVYLSIQKPLRLADQGHWTVEKTLLAVQRGQGAMRPFTDPERQRILDAGDIDSEEQWEALKRTIEQKGYDGIVYTNRFEDKGKDSYIAFRPEQIKSTSAARFDPTAPGIMAELDPADIAERIPLKQSDAENLFERGYNLYARGEAFPEVRTWRQWVATVPSEDIALVLENDETLYRQFLSRMPEATAYELVEAYKAGLLERGATRPGIQTPAVELEDVKFAARGGIGEPVPTAIMPAVRLKTLWGQAIKRVTARTRQGIQRARKALLIQHHVAPIEKALGVTRSEINKKLRSWANYPAAAVDLHNSLNADKPAVSQWTGIQNMALVNQAEVLPEDIDAFVKNVDPTEDWYDPADQVAQNAGRELRQYIARAFLGINTRIDYSDLSFTIDSHMKPRGVYYPVDTSIAVQRYAKNTVAHEIGHYLDDKFAREAGVRSGYASDGIKGIDISPERQQWLDRFQEFVLDISVRADPRSEYTQRPQEVFARFIDGFVRWTEEQAGVPTYSENLYDDKFTRGDYVTWVGMLQEKALVDAKDGNPLGTGIGSQFQKDDWKTASPLVYAPARFESGRMRVSTRQPAGVGARETREVLRTDLDAMNDPAANIAKGKQLSYKTKVANLFRNYPLLSKAELATLKTDDEVLRASIDRMKDNLRYLWNEMPGAQRERAKLWYVGANRIAGRIAEKASITAEQASGVLARLSPQQDWFRNVAQAERLVDVYTDAQQRNPYFSEKLWRHYEVTDMASAHQQITQYSIPKARQAAYLADRKADQERYRELYKGKRWSSLDAIGRAVMVRMIDETKNKRDYHIISPEGDRAGLVTRKDGTPGRLAWGNYGDIAGAISIMDDGSPENIDLALGNKHKVRSFFNNISDPDNADAVTIDTHAIAAAHMEPMAGGSFEVQQSMSGPAAKGAGLYGSNAVYAQAYFELANELGVLPREVQSVTWEQARMLFKPEQKRSPLPTLTRDLWAQFRAGKLSREEVYAQTHKAAGGFASPAWAATPAKAQADEGERGARAVPGELPRVPAAGRRAGVYRGPARGRAERPDGLVRGLGALADQALEQAPTFYSQLRQVVEAKVPAKVSVDQVENILKKGGVKQDELEWTGVREWLLGRDDKLITKPELLDYLDKNTLELQETMLGEKVDQTKAFDRYTNAVSDFSNLYQQLVPKSAVLGEDAVDDVDTLVRAMKDGDERYGRVHLGQLHSQNDITQAAYTELATAFDEVGEAWDHANMRETPSRYKDYTLPGGKDYRELLIQLPEDATAVDVGTRGKEPRTFSSGHFIEPNIVAHVRFKTRTGPNGEKVLAVEEVQSDWHQQGRKYGYDRADDPKVEQELARLRERRRELGERLTEQRATVHQAELARDQMRRAVYEEFNLERDAVGMVKADTLEDVTPEEVGKIQEKLKPVIRLEEEARRNARNTESQLNLVRQEIDNLATGLSSGNVVPDAPFKTSWAELAMKRMLRYAAEGGFDSIAWTTGQQQADRYDLSKRISAVNYVEATNTLTALDKEGNIVLSETVMPEKVGDYIGQEAATKLLAAKELVTYEVREHQPPTAADPYGRRTGVTPAWEVVGVSEGGSKTVMNVFSTEHQAEMMAKGYAKDQKGVRRLRGQDLVIGGEGMKQFYDKMLPSAMKKFGKKWGAKVEDVSIGSRVVDDFTDGTPIEGEGLSVVESDGEFSIVQGHYEEVVAGPEPSEAQAWVAYKLSERARTTMHGMRITPEMRESLLYQGQPLFEKQAVTRAQLEKIAKLRGTSVETQAQRARRAGYEVPDFRQPPRPRQGPAEAEEAKPIPKSRVLEYPSLQKHPEEVRSDVADILVQADGFQKQRRDVQSVERTKALAAAMELPSRKLRPGTAANAEELYAYANAIDWSISEFKRLEAKGGDITNAESLEMDRLWGQAVMLTESFRGLKAETGRAMNILRAQRNILDTKEAHFINRAVTLPGFDGDMERVRKSLEKAGDDPAKMLEELKKHSATWFDYVQAYAYQNMLSGLKTHLRNTIGNTANLTANLALVPIAADPIERYLAGRDGRAREVYSQEAALGMRSALAASFEGARKAAFAFTHGYRMSEVDEALVGNFDFKRVEIPGLPERVVGERLHDWSKLAFNYASRGLVAGDEFFRHMAYQAEIDSGLYAQLRKEGLTKPEDFERRGAEILSATRGPDWEIRKTLMRRADEFAARMVFQEKPGRFVSAMISWKNDPDWRIRWLGMAIAPFVRTPGAILKQGLEWSPAGFVMKEARKGTAFDPKGDQRQGAQARGRAAIGSMLSLPIAMAAAAGWLTGAPPDDPEDREEFYQTGRLPNAFWVPLGGVHGPGEGDGLWVRYVLFQPFSISAAMYANAFGMLAKKEKAGEEITEADLEGSLVAGFAGAIASLLDQSFLSGVDTILSTMQNPERSWQRFLQNAISPYIPNSGLLRNIVQATDKTIRRPKGMWESVKALNPMQSKELVPLYTRHGEPAERSPENFFWRGFVVPMVSRAVTDKTTMELERLGIKRARHRGGFRSGGVDFGANDDQKALIGMAVGYERKVRLEEIVESRSYDSWDDEKKYEELTSAYRDASTAVRKRVVDREKLKRAWALENLMTRENYRKIEDPTRGEDTWPQAR